MRERQLASGRAQKSRTYLKRRQLRSQQRKHKRRAVELHLQARLCYLMNWLENHFNDRPMPPGWLSRVPELSGSLQLAKPLRSWDFWEETSRWFFGLRSVTGREPVDRLVNRSDVLLAHTLLSLEMG